MCVEISVYIYIYENMDPYEKFWKGLKKIYFAGSIYHTFFFMEKN